MRLTAELRAWVVFISAFHIFCHISIRRKETRAASARNHDRPSASLRKQKRAQKRSARVSRDGRRARRKSGPKPQKNKSKPKQKNEKANCSKPPACAISSMQEDASPPATLKARGFFACKIFTVLCLAVLEREGDYNLGFLLFNRSFLSR
jgi:hypothetical protein